MGVREKGKGVMGLGGQGQKDNKGSEMEGKLALYWEERGKGAGVRGG